MKILALDTSSRYGSIALCDEDQVILELTVRGIVNQSEHLVPLIRRSLEDVGWTIADIDGFGVVNGPGSFTGIRVGLATVEGLAFATGRPAVALSSLRALALGVPDGSLPVCPVLNARRGEIYAALFAWHGDRLVERIPECAAPPDRIARLLEGDVLIVGDGAELLAGAIDVAGGAARAVLSRGSSALLRASIVGVWAAKTLARDSGGPLPPLRPNYVRETTTDLGLRKPARPPAGDPGS